jgi:23S rRNA (guanosine2251-2'-O)-methyltransferase
MIYWMYGLHPVSFAIENKKRKIYELICLEDSNYGDLIAKARVRKIPVQILHKSEFQKLTEPGWVHQGILAKCESLPPLDMEEISGDAFLMLDQVTDPHNVGAILRTAAAFGINGVIMQDKNAPKEGGILAKTACGALEIVPIIYAVNLSRTLLSLKEKGFWVVGFDETGEKNVSQINLNDKVVMVMGAEGSGIRKLIRENCDFLARLPTKPYFPTLNVSVACALALYEWSSQTSK